MTNSAPNKICFIMDFWEEIKADSDSTLRIIHEHVKREHEVFITHATHVSVKDSQVYARCKKIISYKSTSVYTSFYKSVKFYSQWISMMDFDCIFLRSNPPLDTNLLYFLDYIKHDVFIMNSLRGLRSASNKLYVSSLEAEDDRFTPYTYVSRDKEYIKTVIKESEEESMVLKPLDGYGGKGVIVIEKAAKKNINSLLDFYMDKADNYVILQEYLKGAENGDVRILMLNGKPIGAMKRIPAKGEARSNIHAGGKEEKHKLTTQEKELCRLIGPKLVEDGLYFVGLDVINGKLLEVNVCSPGGVTRINKLNATKTQVKIVDFIEKSIENFELEKLNQKKD